MLRRECHSRSSHLVDCSLDWLSLQRPCRHGLLLTYEANIRQRGRKSLRGRSERAGDHAQAIGHEQTAQQFGHEWNQTQFVEHVGTQDDRKPLVRRIAPVEMADRILTGTESILRRVLRATNSSGAWSWSLNWTRSPRATRDQAG